MKNLILHFDSPAESSDAGWEKESLPLGNGYFGCSVFGDPFEERLQFATNAFANDYSRGGVSNFAEIHLHFPEKEISSYERHLDLRKAIAVSSYRYGDSKVTRTSFLSYPDHVFVYHIQSDAPISFSAELIIPFLGSRPIEEGGRTGEVTLDGNTLVMRGTLPFRKLIYEGRLAILTDGEVKGESGQPHVQNAKDATILFAAGTSYKLCPEVFFKNVALGEDPHEDVVSRLEKAKSLGYDKLYENHEKDFTSLMDRVDLDLGGSDEGKTMTELFEEYRAGKSVPYLEELYFSMGRYLLISSSRKGSLPASLQGVWNVHDKSPWGSGFWHNINIQMNYWPAFSTNLAETFLAYADFNKNYIPKAQEAASSWIKQTNPKEDDRRPGEDGWIIGTGSYAYEVEGQNLRQHSGPGTGAMTTELFYDAYAFTGNETFLKEYAFPAVHGMAKYLTKCVKRYDTRYLCAYSASPEQSLCGHWETGDKVQAYYHTVGCSFDQQLIEENAKNDLVLAKAMHVSDETTRKEKSQLSHYDAVRVGYSGQIKEYDEEHFYGEIGDGTHRHISQLVGLMPGTSISHLTPAWLDAAKLTLTYRGDKSTGWALAHRLNAWARCGEGDHAYSLVRLLLERKTNPNLWDEHPPFQIDGNFGATSGIAEMLLQSHEGYISLFPALPKAWKKVSFVGLKARGNFTVSASLENHKVQECRIESVLGGKIIFTCPGLVEAVLVEDEETHKKVSHIVRRGFLSFVSQKGHTYRLFDFDEIQEKDLPKGFHASYESNCVRLSWRSGARQIAVFRVKDSDPHYELLGITEEKEFLDGAYNVHHKGRLTYKLVDASAYYDESDAGPLAVLDPADELEKERYKLRYETNNLNKILYF